MSKHPPPVRIMDDILAPMTEKPTRFMDRFRTYIRTVRLSYKAEKTHCAWVIRIVRLHDLQSEQSLKPKLIKAF